MKRFYLLSLFISVCTLGSAQIKVNDSVYLFLDSLYMTLPEVMITGERPMVKAEEGKLIYDLPRLVQDLPVTDALEAIKQLPGIADMNGTLTLAGSGIHIIIDGKVSTLSVEQLYAMLASIPVASIEKAEVMHAAPARYQVRGPMVNLVLKKNSGGTRLTGEALSAYTQQYYDSYRQRASLLYSSDRLSADLLYSFSHNRGYMGTNKEAVHRVEGVDHTMTLADRVRTRSNNHNLRLGADYTLAPNHVLSAVYTTQFSNYDNHSRMSGTQNSTGRRDGESWLHNLSLGYRAPFGLDAGVEFTFYQSPDKQYVHSTLGNDELAVRYDEKQRINKWRFHATQSHEFESGWGLNYGAHFTTGTDNSYQYYFDIDANRFVPENSMKTRRQERIFNAFAGFSKAFGQQFSLDASLAAELYHSGSWHEWMAYPTLNATYMPSAEHIFQLSLSSDKRYPDFWSVNSSVAYLSAYSEIHGNPDLKPSSHYNTSLTYVLKSKYLFTAFFNHMPDYFAQTLYQLPDRLAEVYKFVNMDFQQQFGLQVTVPFRVGSRINSRFTAVGYHKREKDSDFWDIPFDRRHTSFQLMMNNSITLSTRPNLLLNISGNYQNGSTQGIYDLSNSGSLNAALRWTSNNQKFIVNLNGIDLLNTAQVNPTINFKGQKVKNRFVPSSRGVEISFTYRFGNYKEKEREEVDTSRFK